MSQKISYEFEKNLVGFCGLYCRECIYYKNIFQIKAKDFFDEIKNHDEIRLVWESLNAPFDIDQFVAGLQWLAASSGCLGCRAGGGWPECPIRKCAHRNEVQGCFQCNDYPCTTISGKEGHYQRKLIERIKNTGLVEYIMTERGEK